MPVAHDTEANATAFGVFVSSITFSKTTSGADRCLWVSVAQYQGANGPVTGITFNGVSMVEAGAEAASASWSNYTYTLVAPATGANNVVVTMASGDVLETACGASSYTGVDQATPTSGYATATGTSTTPSVVVVSATNDMVVAGVSFITGGTMAPAGGETEEWDAAGSQVTATAGYREAGAASVTISLTQGGADTWAMSAVNLKAATGGDPALGVLIGEPMVGSSIF